MTTHDIVEKFHEMSPEDIEAAIASDPIVSAVLRAVPDADRPKIRAYILDFIEGWKRGAIDPLVSMMSDPQFVEAFMSVAVGGLRRRDDG